MPTSLRDKLNVSPPEDKVGFVNLFVYGEPGSGKTYLIGTADEHEETRPLLLIDCEGGTLTLRKKKGIDVVTARTINEVVKIHNEVKMDTSGYYKTVAIDTLNELAALDMRDIMKELINRRPDLDPDVPSPREWGKNREHVRTLVRGYRDLPVNTIIAAHLNETRDEDGNIIGYGPALAGKLKSDVSGFMDIVGMLRAEKKNDKTMRTLQVEKTKRVIAKDRSGMLGEIVENPTIPLIWELMHG